MNSRIHIVILFAATFLCRAVAQEKPLATITVAVCDFTDADKTRRWGPNTTALVTANLTTETNLVMVERGGLKNVLHEQAFDLSGMVSSDAAARIGQITGAKVLVVGQIIKISHDQLVIVADIIGTETGRLFAAKVAGPAENLMEMTTDLSRQIAQTITAQAGNLMAATAESRSERLDHIIKGIQGTNRPSVSVNLHWPWGPTPGAAPSGELGAILMKAGFTVVDGRSDHKADFEITGVVGRSDGPAGGGLVTIQAIVTSEVRERRDGKIIAFERGEGIGTDATRVGADRLAEINAVDAVAEKILPLLAK